MPRKAPESIQGMLRAILHAVDYTTGACRPNEMVGAVLDKRLIEQARLVLGQSSKPHGEMMAGSDDEDDAFMAICRDKAKPMPDFYQAGWDAHAAGRQFHEGPQPFHSVEALSWRIGWNDRALTQA